MLWKKNSILKSFVAILFFIIFKRLICLICGQLRKTSPA